MGTQASIVIPPKLLYCPERPDLRNILLHTLLLISFAYLHILFLMIHCFFLNTTQIVWPLQVYLLSLNLNITVSFLLSPASLLHLLSPPLFHFLPSTISLILSLFFSIQNTCSPAHCFYSALFFPSAPQTIPYFTTNMLPGQLQSTTGNSNTTAHTTSSLYCLDVLYIYVTKKICSIDLLLRQ